MKRSLCILSVIFPLAVLGQPLKAQDATAPASRLTSAQAIQIAKDFCQKIGKPVTDEAFTHFPDKLYKNSYWQPLWDVQCGRQAEVIISDADGLVVDYDDDSYLRVEDSTPPDPNRYLPSEKAEKIGLDFVRQTGEREDLGEPSVSMFSPSRVPSAHSTLTTVEWKRMFHGIPYLEEAARVNLSAVTGEVVGSILVFPSPPPTADEAALAQNPTRMVPIDQAVGLTQAHLLYDQGLTGSATLHEAKLVVVTVPIGLDTPALPQPKVGRIAWDVRYTGDIWGTDTWIDAETGQVIGGDGGYSGGYGGSSKHPAASMVLPLKTMLPGLKAVYVRRADNASKSGWAAIKSATFTAKDQPKQIVALRKAAPVAAPAVLPDDQLVLVGKNNSLGEFRYDPKSGRLGTGADWVSVPNGFRVWMQKRLSIAESKPGPKL